MILLIIVYWDDVGGFNLYPLQDSKHEPPASGSTASPSPSPRAGGAEAASSSTKPPVADFNAEHIPETLTEAAEERREGEGEDKQRKEQSMMSSAEDREQEARKQRIVDVCAGKDGVDFPGRTRAFEQVPNRELDHLIVDDEHRIIYCYVPKVQYRWVNMWVIVRNVIFIPPLTFPVSSLLTFLLAVLGSGCLHQLEASDGDSVPVSDLALLRKTLHWPRGCTTRPGAQLLSAPHVCQVRHAQKLVKVTYYNPYGDNNHTTQIKYKYVTLL